MCTCMHTDAQGIVIETTYQAGEVVQGLRCLLCMLLSPDYSGYHIWSSKYC